MRTKAIRSSWLHQDGRRLDCGPYMSGAREAKLRLDTMKAPKMALKDVTLGGAAGLVNAGRIKRVWVEGPEHGRRFLSSTDILQADLSKLRFISNRAVRDNPKLVIRKGWTLITRAGTIGRMAYARPDMDAFACTEDVLRVIPDESRIPPGYLYAYLSSKFGVPLVVGGTYGAIIQHIEPHHIAHLPVPRLGEAVELAAHDLMQEGADALAEAAGLRSSSGREIVQRLGLSELSSGGTSTSYQSFSIPSGALTRLDAAHYAPGCIAATIELERCCSETRRLRELAQVFTPGIFKRPYVDDPNYGYPYFSGTELFQQGPLPRGYLSKSAPNIEGYVVRRNWLLLQDAGQLGGLVGRLVRVGPDVANGVVSNHLMRIVPGSDNDGAYLFALLSSPHGYRAITRNAFGTSIPQLDPKHIADLVLPWPQEADRQAVAKLVLQSWCLEDRAIEAQREAVALVEAAIEEAA